MRGSSTHRGKVDGQDVVGGLFCCGEAAALRRSQYESLTGLDHVFGANGCQLRDAEFKMRHVRVVSTAAIGPEAVLRRCPLSARSSYNPDAL